MTHVPDQGGAGTSAVDDDQTMALATAELDGGTVVRVAGEVDMVTSPRLQAALSRLLADRPPTLVLDLDGITFLGSSGLAVIVEADEEARETGVRFALAASTRGVLRPLEATGLAGLVDVHPDVTAALAGR